MVYITSYYLLFICFIETIDVIEFCASGRKLARINNKRRGLFVTILYVAGPKFQKFVTGPIILLDTYRVRLSSLGRCYNL